MIEFQFKEFKKHGVSGARFDHFEHHPSYYRGGALGILDTSVSSKFDLPRLLQSVPLNFYDTVTGTSTFFSGDLFHTSTGDLRSFPFFYRKGGLEILIGFRTVMELTMCHSG